MAVTTRINGFNLGTDVRFAIKDDFGDVFSDAMLGHLTSFDIRTVDQVVKVTPITQGGVPVNQTVFNGVTGSMRFVRTGPNFSRFVLDLVDAFHDGGIISQLSIAWQVKNRDQTIDQYMITGGQITSPDHGRFAGLREVDMNLGLVGSRLTATGNLGSLLTNLAGAY
jgi:hypothetical protein